MFSIHKTCRLCLSEESLSDVLDEEGLQQWIRDYLSITISPEDQISHNVCTICQIRLSEFHQFRLSCHEVQTVLQSMIQRKNAESQKGLSNEVDYDHGQVRSVDIKSGYDHESSSEKQQRESYSRTDYEEVENGQQIDVGNIIHVEEIKIEAFESEQTLSDNNSVAQQKDVIDKVASFECYICHKKFSSRKLLSQHDRVMHREKRYKCSVCKIGFAYRANLMQHLKTRNHIDKQTALQSMIQRKNAESVEGQIRSIDLKSGYDHESSTEKHQQERSNKADYEEAENGQQIDLGSIIHVEEVKIEALESEQTLTDNNSEAQQNDAIDEVLSFECKFCHKRWPSKRKLRRHYMVVHEKKRYECSVCKIGFAQRANLKQHLQTRNHLDKQNGITVVKPFQCDECEKSFQQQTNLNVHKKRIHAAKTHCCHVCGYKCSDRMTLAHHILRHDLKSQKETKSVQVAREFKCDVCEKILKSSRNLNFHKKYVHGPKMYECHICSFSFTARYRLERHIPVHADQSEEYIRKLQQMKQNGTSCTSQSQDEAEATIKSDPDAEKSSATGQQVGQDTAVRP